MPIARNLARLVFGVVLGASAVFGCESGNSSALTSQCADAAATGCQDAGVGGTDAAAGTCVEICAKADICCVATTMNKDGGIPCDRARTCGATSSDDQLIGECQTFIALFPLNPSCQ